MAGTNVVLKVNDLLPCLKKLQLNHSDVIVLSEFPKRDAADASNPWNWTSSYCQSNKVAVYVHPGNQLADGTAAVPIYHWVAPFENPRSLTEAQFFFEGRPLGAGGVGFERMLKDIETRRPKQFLVVGSLYDMANSFGPLERPYEKRQSELDQVVARTGSELVLTDPLPGF